MEIERSTVQPTFATRYLVVHNAIAIYITLQVKFYWYKSERKFQWTAVSLRRQKCFITWVLFQRPHMWDKLFYLLHSRRHGVAWLNSRWWMAACGWQMYIVRVIDAMHIVKSNQIKSNLFAINSVHNITMSLHCVWLDRQAITSHLCLPVTTKPKK